MFEWCEFYSFRKFTMNSVAIAVTATTATTAETDSGGGGGLFFNLGCVTPSLAKIYWHNQTASAQTVWARCVVCAQYNFIRIVRTIQMFLNVRQIRANAFDVNKLGEWKATAAATSTNINTMSIKMTNKILRYHASAFNLKRNKACNRNPIRRNPI